LKKVYFITEKRLLRGIPDDLIAHCLSNLLIVEPATGVADCEPWPRSILKRPKKGRLNLGWGAHRGVGMFPTSVLGNLQFSETHTKH
jgi:hypothetical protein